MSICPKKQCLPELGKPQCVFWWSSPKLACTPSIRSFIIYYILNMGSLLLEMTKDPWGQKKQHIHFPFFGIMKRLGQSRFWDKNASAGNRTRVDSLEGYNSTTKPPMLIQMFKNEWKEIIIFPWNWWTSPIGWINFR